MEILFGVEGIGDDEVGSCFAFSVGEQSFWVSHPFTLQYSNQLFSHHFAFHCWRQPNIVLFRVDPVSAQQAYSLRL